VRGKPETIRLAVRDLVQAYEVVVQAPVEEQQELYEIWRGNTTQTLSLIVSPEDLEAWKTYSDQPIDWSSERKAALQLRLIQAHFRVLVRSAA
jgi:hypothetical protein